MNWLLPNYYTDEYRNIVCKYCGRIILLKQTRLDNYKIIPLNLDGSLHIHSQLEKSEKNF